MRSLMNVTNDWLFSIDPAALLPTQSIRSSLMVDITFLEQDKNNTHSTGDVSLLTCWYMMLDDRMCEGYN
jgi:hypothetical protein